MKVSKEYLQQIINEEIDNMIEEGEINEGPLDFVKSLGGSAGRAVKGAAQKAGSAVASRVGQAATAVKGAAQKAGSAVSSSYQKAKANIDAKAALARKNLGTAVNKARGASFDADTKKVLESTHRELLPVFKKIDSLFKRQQALAQREGAEIDGAALETLYELNSYLTSAYNLSFSIANPKNATQDSAESDQNVADNAQ